jgi:hypothetical protein
MTTTNALDITGTGYVSYNGSGTFNERTMTAGTGITITNGTGVSGNTTFNAVGAGLTWSDQGTSFAAAVNNGYFVTAAAAATMPASPAEGDTIAFYATTSGACTVTGNTGQVLEIGNTSSASAGTAASTKAGDSVTFTYRTTGTTWWGRAVQGSWTVT